MNTRSLNSAWVTIRKTVLVVEISNSIGCKREITGVIDTIC